MLPEFAVGSMQRPMGMRASLTGGVPDEEGVRNVFERYNCFWPSAQTIGPQVEA